MQVTATWQKKSKKCCMHDCYAYWLEDILKTCANFYLTFIFTSYLEVFASAQKARVYNATVLQNSEQKDGTNGQFWARLPLEFTSNISSFVCFQDFIQRLLLSSRSMLSFKNTSLYNRNGNTQVRCRSPLHFTFRWQKARNV